MPVDDSGSSALTNRSFLSVEAAEFVPRNADQDQVQGAGEENNPNSTTRTTGAVPKSSKFFNDRRKNGNKNNFRNQPHDNRSTSRPKGSFAGNSEDQSDRKFFKDNQRYFRGGSAKQSFGKYSETNHNHENRGNPEEFFEGSSSQSQNQNGNFNVHSRNSLNSRNRNESRYQRNGNSRQNQENRFHDSRNSRNQDIRGNEKVKAPRFSEKEANSEIHLPSKRNHHEDPPRHALKPSQSSRKFKKDNSVEASKINQRDQLIKDIENNKLECLICCDRIRDYQSTWSCSNCFHILHLNCIKTWITNSKTETGEWRCPACQLSRREVPKDYFCFCGKVKYPSVNRNDLAHSCGEMCNRTDNCSHPCTLLCHPGPHSICQSVIERFCGCGKNKKTYQCSMRESFECEEICSKPLNCGVHKCKSLCHQGSCEPCSEEVSMTCHCEKSSKKETCDSETALLTTFSCDQVCDKTLSCGNHKCTMKCHSGDCYECQLQPKFVRSCPCGRSKVPEGQRLICTDEVPVCKAICSKLLKCGPLASPHSCIKPCHVGDCPPCLKKTKIRCRCGKAEEQIACKDLLSTDVRCKKKCSKFKTCGKHRCNQTCCIELDHICLQQCGRMLECKKHRCQLPCHIGNCLQCPRASFDELKCECGASVIYPPVPCGTRPPECSRKCTRTHKCSHPVNHLCHSEPECPPCVYLTAKLCYGKHEERKTIPCNQESFSCGMPCGKEIKCGRHKCTKQCHLGNCEKPSDICKQLCPVKRLECEHNCNAPCHDGSCPDKPCRLQIEVTCKCGNLKEMKTCEQVSYENKKLQRVRLAMQMQQDGDNLDLKDVMGDAGKKTFKILECNDECAVLERNRRLDIAFKVENPNLISYPKFVPNYSDFVKGFYKKDPAFVNMVFEKLTELVKLAKESKQKSRSHSFPVMNREKRHVCHDLAAMFGAETQAYDAEPNRNVVATASRESCWLPSLSVSEVLARETGLRQVRPPSNFVKK